MLQLTPELFAKYPHRWVDGSGIVVRSSRDLSFFERAGITKEFLIHGSHIGEFTHASSDFEDVSYCVYDVDVVEVADRVEAPLESNLLEAAWGIIANAHEGDWDRATCQWREAATRWRDEYHKTLGDQTTPDDDKYRFKVEINGLMIHSDVLLWKWAHQEITRQYLRRGNHEGLIEISVLMINYRVYSIEGVPKPTFDSLGSALTVFAEEFQVAGDKFLDTIRKAFPNG